MGPFGRSRQAWARQEEAGNPWTVPGFAADVARARRSHAPGHVVWAHSPSVRANLSVRPGSSTRRPAANGSRRYER
jgi:hypothetical protein